MKVIFFDLNDTLINHSRAQEVAIKKMSLLLPKHSETEFFSVWRKASEKYWRIFEDKKITFEEQRLLRIESVWKHFKSNLTNEQTKKYANDYMMHYEKALRVNPVLKIILELSMAQGISAGIISNGYGPLQRHRLRMARIDSMFVDKLIFISGEVGFVKPNKKIFDLAEKVAELPPSEITFFGDEFKNDIVPAKKRGWQAIFVPSW